MRPDRIVIGAESDEAVEIMKELYRPLYLIETPFIVTDVATAEMIKYTSNVFLASKISFINEVANVCERVGADVHVVARSMGLDGRISSKFLHPGPGFGGSCFPKDVSALVAAADAVDYDFKIGKAVLEVNSRQREIMVDKIAKAAGDLRGKRIGFFGLAFKPNTDDMRDSPTIEIIRGLQERGAEIRAYDPAAMDNARSIFEGRRLRGRCLRRRRRRRRRGRGDGVEPIPQHRPRARQEQHEDARWLSTCGTSTIRSECWSSASNTIVSAERQRGRSTPGPAG